MRNALESVAGQNSSPMRHRVIATALNINSRSSLSDKASLLRIFCIANWFERWIPGPHVKGLSKAYTLKCAGNNLNKGNATYWTSLARSPAMKSMTASSFHSQSSNGFHQLFMKLVTSQNPIVIKCVWNIVKWLIGDFRFLWTQQTRGRNKICCEIIILWNK
jgi:hypothetical protein